MTLDRLPTEAVDLLPPLAQLVPPAEVIDKGVYSPWFDGALEARLHARDADTLVVTGTETDVCVLAVVLGAINRGYRVLVPADAICSSSDDGRDALLGLLHRRFSQQVEASGQRTSCCVTGREHIFRSCCLSKRGGCHGRARLNHPSRLHQPRSDSTDHLRWLDGQVWRNSFRL